MTRPSVHFAIWPSWHLAAIPAKSLASHHRTLAGHAGDAIFKVDKQDRKKALAFFGSGESKRRFGETWRSVGFESYSNLMERRSLRLTARTDPGRRTACSPA